MPIVNLQLTLSSANIQAMKRINQNGIYCLEDDVEAAEVLELIVSDIADGHVRKNSNVLMFPKLENADHDKVIVT